MKAPRSKPAQIAKPAPDEFEIALVAELQQLRTSEKLLQRMYPRLKTTPQLRGQFLQQLAEMQLRAQRLDAVLNPIGAMRFALPVAPAISSPAA
jgi:ferritin-like metal-binding protein YciE